jgi:hypothetical protein
MVARRSSYLTWDFECTHVKVLHCRLIRWDRRTTALQDHLALVRKLVWRPHSRPRLHCRLTRRIPIGTLGMRLATRVTMRVVVTTSLMVTPRVASELEPLPLPGTLTSTPIWSSTLVMGLTRLSARSVMVLNFFRK